MTKPEIMVEGEPVSLIVEALQSLTPSGREKDGMLLMKGKIGGDSGAALLHALGCITAELQARDMRSFLPGGSRTERTDGQRRADALVLLIDRVSEAVGLDVPPLVGQTLLVDRARGLDIQSTIRSDGVRQ